MSELCTLAASVILQSSSSGAPGPAPSSLPSPENPLVALLDSNTDEHASGRCDGPQTMVKQSLELMAPTIAPETDTATSIVEEVEFSHPQSNLVSQVIQEAEAQEEANLVSQVVQEPEAQEEANLVSQVGPEAETNVSAKGALPVAVPVGGTSRPVFPVPLTRPLALPPTKPGFLPQPQTIQPSVDLLEHRDTRPDQAPTIPPGWPSLLHPQIHPSPSQPSTRPSVVVANPHPTVEEVSRWSAFSPSITRPQSGHQLYQQRWAALAAGKTYTRLPANSFESQWKYANYEPTHEDWLHLLSREARSMAAGQGDNALTVIVGDSLSLWMPTEFLPQHQFWLNQSISGETAAGMVQRLYMFDRTNPDTIHVMAGINDLKNGATDGEVLGSLQTMMQQLRYKHPQAEVIIHSILPTRLPHLPSDRIRSINQQLVQIAQQEGTTFLDLQTYFSDPEGHLRQDLTTDGLHLNYRGYTMWQAAIRQRG